MFGMEQEKAKKAPEFVYDLEAQAQSSTGFKALNDRLATAIAKLKTLMQSGADQAVYDKVTVVLIGYVALQKVVQKLKGKTLP